MSNQETTARVRMPNAPFVIPDRVAQRAATRWEPGDGGCWISTYSVASHGYAQIGWQDDNYRQVVTAHRAAWVHVNGQIPPGMTVDHVCRVRRCVNPAHLRLMTNVDNATSNGRGNRRKPTPTGTLCSAGHEVLLYASGAKHCRECANAWARAKYQRQQRVRSGAPA